MGSSTRILGAVAKKESDDKSRRIRRKHEELAATGKRSGGGSRPSATTRTGVTVRPAEAAIVRETPQVPGGRVDPVDLCRPERPRGALLARWCLVAADVAADARLRPDQRAARAQGRDRRHGGVARDHRAGRDRADPRTARRPDRQTNKTARRYLLAGLLKCSLCGERLVARPRSGGLRRYACAKGPGFSGCGGTYINAEPLEPFIVEAVLWRIDSPELTAALNGRQDEPDAERWQAEADAARAQLEELGDRLRGAADHDG